MKQNYIIKSLFLMIFIPYLTYSQTTITFDLGYVDNFQLGLTEDIAGFTFTIDGGAGDDITFDDGTHSTSGTSALYDDNIDLNGITKWTITRTDASEFQLVSIYLQDAGFATANGTISAYRDGAQIGVSVAIDFDGLKTLSGNSDFENIDEFRIEGTDINFYLDDLTYIVDNTWSGATDNDWNTATNWSTGTVPVESTKVSIPSGLTNYPTAAAAVTVSAVTIESGGTLKADDTFTGDVTYKRNLATTNWYLISSPVSGETIEDLRTNNAFANGSGGNRIGLAPYDNSQTTAAARWAYQTTTSTGSVDNGKGYSVKLNAVGDVSFSGSLNTADVSIALTQGNGSGGNDSNLIGNPFTSFINSATFLTTNTAELTSQTIWLWNQATTSYEAKVTVDAFKIAPGQGFFVDANSTNNVIFEEAIQNHENSDTFQRTSRPEVHLIVSDGTENKLTKLYYLDNATTAFDNGLDGEMFNGVSNPFAVYTHLLSNSQGKGYSIQSLPNSNFETMVTPVGVNANAGKEITFSVDALNLPTDMKVFLEDKVTNTFTRLDETNTNYTITLSEALNGVGRFYMHTSRSALTVGNISLSNVSIYKSDVSTLRIVGLPQGNTTVKLFNILGKEFINGSFNVNGVKDISLPKLATGIYIVEIQTETGKLSKKITL